VSAIEVEEGTVASTTVPDDAAFECADSAASAANSIASRAAPRARVCEDRVTTGIHRLDVPKS
jgi:hypothetical protein